MPPLNGAVLLPSGQPSQQPVMQIAAPMNDIQLVALVAAHLFPHYQEPDATIRAGEAVRAANEIVALAVVTGKQGYIQRRIQELETAWEAEAKGRR